MLRLRSLRLRAMLVVCAAAAAPLGIIAFSDLENWPVRLTLAVLASAGLMAWWLGWRMVRPLRQLQDQALRGAWRAAPKGGKPPEHALRLDRDDEFGDLADAFNALLAALDARKQSNEAFVADLVHEVKNPVAAVRAAAEALERGPADAERAARLARILKDSSARLDAVASRFLELARAEAGSPGEARSDVPLHAVARGIIDALQAAHPAVTFEADLAMTHVNGVPAAIESSVRNLLENAASFALLGDGPAIVRVSLGSEQGRCVMVIEDSGPGIERDDLPKVFDRFFSRRRTDDGTGLGLAMVRAVAEAHGGSVSADNGRNGGAVLVLTLPAP